MLELRYLLKWKVLHGEYQPTWTSCEAHKGSGRFIRGMASLIWACVDNTRFMIPSVDLGCTFGACGMLHRIGTMFECVLVLALSLLF